MILASDLLIEHNGSGRFTINRPILETGGSRSLTKTGTGILTPRNTATPVAFRIASGIH
jgi:hypothetical protein